MALLVKIGTLGKMAAEFAGIERRGGFLVTTLQVKEAVPWEVVSAVSYAETLQIVKAVIKPSVIWFLFSGWAHKKTAKPPKL
jgi:hypothetical protein